MTVYPVPRHRAGGRRRARRLPGRSLAVTAVLMAVFVGAIGSRAGMFVSVGVAAVALFAVSAYYPIFATYAYLLTLPFIAGIDRNTLIPLLRPNEAVLVLLLAGASLGTCGRALRGDPPRVRAFGLVGQLATFVLLATVWPVTWMMLRGQTPHASDLAAVLPICKLTALLLLVRTTVATEAQRVRCIRFIVWPGAAIAAIAVLQTLNVGPVVSALASLWPSGQEEMVQRGTTTLSSPIATGDYIVISLTLLICSAAHGLLRRTECLALGFILSAGVLAAGQFSAWIAAVVVMVVLVRRFPRLRRSVGRFLPIVGAAALLGAPAFLGRLAGFGAGTALPQSWVGRWNNLSHFYLPQLGDFHFIFGVSPNTVLPAPETWRTEIFLESGYLQLLWVGGIPLLVAFGWLSVGVLRSAGRLGCRAGALGACATTLQAAWWMLLVLSLIDIHLLLRGTGDLLFTLLAITTRGIDHEEHQILQGDPADHSGADPCAAMGGACPPRR